MDFTRKCTFAVKKNDDISGREICTLSFLMRVPRILQLLSPHSLIVTILRRIYGGILDNLSMPSILVHVHALVYVTTKSTMTEIWNIQEVGANWWQDKIGVRFTQECVKCTQIANPAQTRCEPREDPKQAQSKRIFFKANPKRTQSIPRKQTWGSI